MGTQKVMIRPAHNSIPLVVLSAGGTGGHVYPAEALAMELNSRGCRLALVTDRRGSNLGGRLGELDTYRVRSGGISGKGLFARILNIGEIAIGVLQSCCLLGRLNPSVVIGFGGYASLPMMLAANFSSTATAIHEQNALLGRANRLLSRKVRKIATSYKQMQHMPKSARANVVYTGMPVRNSVEALRETPYPELNERNIIELLVFGGSQGASIFSRVVPEAIKQLDQNLRGRLNLVQQCRVEDYGHLKSAYNQLGLQVEVAAFFEDLPQRMAKAHLVICRAGASAIAELTTIGRPAILVPYPHAVDNHQSVNAHTLNEVGGGWLIPDEAFTPENLSYRLETLFEMPKTLKNAARAAKQAGETNATARLAEMVIDLIPNHRDQWDAGGVA